VVFFGCFSFILELRVTGGVIMRKLFACLSWLGMLGGAALFAGQAKRLVEEVPPASVRGWATVFETINRKPTTNPVRDLQVYLFNPEATKPFEELQYKCRRAMAQPKADPVQTYHLCEIALAEAFELIPTLPAVAKVKTGRDGSFSFDNVSPGRPYHVIGIKPGESGSPIVIVVKTPRLRAGQQFALELSENEPWTGPVM
jgi:hypothetical protein